MCAVFITIPCIQGIQTNYFCCDPSVLGNLKDLKKKKTDLRLGKLLSVLKLKKL